MDQYEQIEQKYSLVLPEAYRSMCAAGWCDVKSDNYFWLPDAEWMSLTEILNHEPEEYHKPEYVPFAVTAGGDYWCWWPSAHPGTIVFCPHDCYDGEYFSPSFTGFIYRKLLEYALSVRSEEEQEVRQNLRDSAARLSTYLPANWRDTLETLASAPLVRLFAPNGREAGLGLLSYEQYQAIVQRDLAFPLLDQEFQWMYPLTGDEAETAAIWQRVLLEADPAVPFEEKIARVEAEKARRKNED